MRRDAGRRVATRALLRLSAPSPGDVAAALAAGPDILVLDPEDACSAALPRSPGPAIFAGVGPLRDGLVDAQLDRLLGRWPEGVVLAGAVGRSELEQIGAKLAVREALAGAPDGGTRVLAMAADSAAGVLAASSLASPRNARLIGLGYDPARLSAELGCDQDGPALDHCAAIAVLAATAAGVPAIVALPAGLRAGEAAAVARRWEQAGFSAVIAPDLETLRAVRDARPAAPSG